MKKPFNNTYILYTCTFLLLLPIVFMPFLTEGKSFVWQLDGLDQHYPSLMYYGKLLRGLLTGKGFAMVDFKVGMGFDTITTLNYYVLGDPVSLLSVFMNSRNSVYFYDFLILLRLYLAGISFILLMKYIRKDGLVTALGALIYVFCGYSLYAGLRHPFFINPMIYLPLIIIGAEKLLKGKKPYLFISMVFISLISNFYFFYSLTIITVIYIIFRYFTVYRKNYKNMFTGLLLTGLKTGGYYLLGAAMTSVIFIPVLYAFSRNGRLAVRPGMASGSYFHYDFKYYIDLLQNIFTPGMSAGYWTVLSFSAVTAASAVVLICHKKYRQLQVIYVLSFLGLSIPAFGYFMNGFSYDANRWCFILSLLTAVMFTLTYEKLFSLERKEKKVLAFVIVIFGLLAFAFPSSHIVKWMFFALLFLMLNLYLLQLQWFRDRKFISSIILYALVFLSLGINGFGLFARQFGNYTDEFLTKKDVIDKTVRGPAALTRDIRDKSFYRIETYGDKALNESLILGYRGVSAYFSLMDGDITDYLKELEVLNLRTAFRLHNLDTRTMLDTLAGVKYFVTAKKESAPYGFTLLKEENYGSEQYYLFQNSYALPLGYTYENYMLKADYDRLGALEKQSAMMSAVILEDDTDYAARTGYDAVAEIKKLNVKITPDVNVSLDHNIIDVKNPEAAITLEFDTVPDSETYIRLSKFNISQKKDIMVDFYADGDLGVRKKINVRSPYYNSYFGKENYLINLGYSTYGQGKAVITFPETMTFSYDSIEAYSVDMSSYAAQVGALNTSALGNIKKSGNRIQGDITLRNRGIMLLSIPYSIGWSAYVDGKKEELLNANIMYMALPLEAGSHHIVLKYETPYLKLGFFVSLAAFFVLLGIILMQKRNNSYHTDKNE